MLAAVVLAGIPGSIVNRVVDAIREKFPDEAVVRAHGAKFHADRYAVYDDENLGMILSEAADAVFGKSERPIGFCRNSHRDCSNAADGKGNSCDRHKDAACGREKPSAFIVAYQEGREADNQKLIDALRHSPMMIKVPRDLYANKKRTSDFIISQLIEMERAIAEVKRHFDAGAPAVLLPPENFGRRELRRLITTAMKGMPLKGALKAFRSQFFKNDSHFAGRSKLAFQPTAPEHAHGGTGLDQEVSIALSSHFRAGCSYSGSFHWDVARDNGDDLSGEVPIYCCVGGTKYPKGHANLLVNDRVR